jgi:Ca-activated chloride channel family protein
MRGLLLTLLLSWTASVQANEFWTSLWHNADQRGEHLLKRGHAAAAAKTYHDQRRKAYAELKAGDYQKAAQDFSAFDDSDGDYNRGNALAQAGQLQDALKAYDAALAHDPNNKDARHNRDLVAKALQQQHPPSQSSSGKNSSSRDGRKGGKETSGSDQSNTENGRQGTGKQGNASKDSSSNEQSGQDQQGKTGPGKQGNDVQGQQAGQGQQQSARNMQNQNAQASSESQNSAATQADEAAQAKRDAEAALGKPQTGNSATPADTRVTEQQLAQEQWLRRIPDDPGGLLRRKFMIEHMIRQQGGQP